MYIDTSIMHIVAQHAHNSQVLKGIPRETQGVARMEVPASFADPKAPAKPTISPTQHVPGDSSTYITLTPAKRPHPSPSSDTEGSGEAEEATGAAGGKRAGGGGGGGEGAKPSAGGAPRRTVFTRHQLSELEARFREQTFLSKEERAHLAEELGLAERQIMIWFQNRRGRLKRRGPSDTAYTVEKLKELNTRRPYPFLYGLLSSVQYRYPDTHHHPYRHLLSEQDDKQVEPRAKRFCEGPSQLSVSQTQATTPRECDVTPTSRAPSVEAIRTPVGFSGTPPGGATDLFMPPNVTVCQTPRSAGYVNNNLTNLSTYRAPQTGSGALQPINAPHPSHHLQPYRDTAAAGGGAGGGGAAGNGSSGSYPYYHPTWPTPATAATGMMPLHHPHPHPHHHHPPPYQAYGPTGSTQMPLPPTGVASVSPSRGALDAVVVATSTSPGSSSSSCSPERDFYSGHYSMQTTAATATAATTCLGQAGGLSAGNFGSHSLPPDQTYDYSSNHSSSHVDTGFTLDFTDITSTLYPCTSQTC